MKAPGQPSTEELRKQNGKGGQSTDFGVVGNSIQTLSISCVT